MKYGCHGQESAVRVAGRIILPGNLFGKRRMECNDTSIRIWWHLRKNC